MKSGIVGMLMLTLHAHLPYVRDDRHEPSMEERWLHEAVADSYLPLIDVMERLVRERVDFRLTISLSPTLLAMLEDPHLRKRTRSFLAKRTELAKKEVFRLWGSPEFGETARMYADRFRLLEELYDRLQGDLIGKLRRFQELGCVQLLASAATHAFLPLVKNDVALRAQLEAAVTEYRRHFGCAPAGIWLPECGYTPALEAHLQALGLRCFFVDAHALGASAAGAGAPVRTPGGACAFARDPEASAQVWDAKTGYPSDPDYREYYRDIGYDLGWGDAAEWSYIKPYMLPDGVRVHTGLKYHRVTGPGDAKAPYRPAQAAEKARQHAEHFLAGRAAEVQRQRAQLDAAGAPPVIVCAFDAELFGHWWHEGPQWLEAVLRGTARSRPEDDAAGVILQTTTPAEYVAEHPPLLETRPSVSSWGRGGYADVWLQPRTDWIYPLLHHAEDRMIAAADAHPEQHLLPDGKRRKLNQAARELLLAQSSDWAFMLGNDTFPAYAERRLRKHLEHVHVLLDGLTGHNEVINEQQQEQLQDAQSCLEQWERQAPFLPQLSYTLYHSKFAAVTRSIESRRAQKPDAAHSPDAEMHITAPAKLRILILAWEYPPHVIGGLSRAVCDLSRYLAKMGHAVHVVTCHTDGSPAYEIMEGVHVHRVLVLQSLKPIEFIDWVFQMNMAFGDHIQTLCHRGLTFDLIHAHDWLVYYAAKESHEALGLPLIATIHATEFGRNRGRLSNPMQKRIHDIEYKLTRSAQTVIVCSNAMSAEVKRLFQLPDAKVMVVPNGVDINPYESLQTASPEWIHGLDFAAEDRMLLYLGRLVYEKGVHLLIDAMKLIIKRIPNAKLVIAGEGPMKEALMKQAEGLGSRVCFTGFVENAEKRYVYREAEVCAFPSLYEPFGIVALEAMASEKPIVVADIGGLSEIVEHGVDGIKVPPGDAAALAVQITELMLQPDRGIKLAQAARRKAEATYQWPAIAASTAGAYYYLLRRS